MQRVAVLGLGIMGSGMASNLLKKGFTITVYNRTRSKAVPFAAQGATVADTPRQAAQDADVVISMVGDDSASREVWLGADGALAGAKPGAVLVESSTLSIEWVHELSTLAREKGLSFLDSPVTGSKSAAANAMLTLFVGGATDTVEKARPALEAISQRLIHLGPNGAGAQWKLINNMMAAVTMVALSEALVLAERAGFNMEQVTPLIQNGPLSGPITQAKLPRALEKRYGDTDFALRWMQKDAGYAIEMAKQYGLPLNTVEAAWRVYQMARDRGLHDVDFAAVVEALR